MRNNMKILLEADIFQGIKNYDRSKLNKASDDTRIETIMKLLHQKYGRNYIKYINTSNKNTNILDIIVSSIDKQGSDTDNNKALFLIDNIIKSNSKPLPREGFQLVSQLLQNNKLDYEENKDWLLDSKLYNPLYKAKAIAFLKTSDANYYGDNPEEAIKDIYKMKEEEEIKRYLSNWQTKNGPEDREKGRDGNSYLLDYLKLSSFRTTAGPVNELKKYIKNHETYKKLKDKSIINNYMDDHKEALEKILKRNYSDKQSFDDYVHKFIREYSE